jgi:hypothetical protein
VKALICALAAAALAPLAFGAGVERIAPPEQGFYAKRVVYRGIAIKAHASVEDRALLGARDKVARMLRSLPHVRENLAAAGAELHVIGAGQATSDLPENRHMKGRPFDGRLTIDERTRGIGGLLASCGEENLLKLAHDRYTGRDICTHEFAHAIYAVGMDDATRQAVAARYASARQQGLWRGLFAETNADEFFAELTMWYFGSQGDPGRLARVEPGAAWLAAHDPQSYELLDRFYSGRLAVQPGIWQASVMHPGGERRLRSTITHERARLVIRNLTASALELYWLDFDGARKRYAAIPPYGFALQDTFARHAWLVLGQDGMARALTTAVEPGSVLTIR